MTRRAGRALAFALTLLAAMACEAPPAAEIPPELVGRWITDDPRFAGRALEIAPTTVRFETGIEAPTTYPILGVEPGEGDEGGGREITVSYTGEGGLAYRLSVRYAPGAPELRLTHRPEVVWTRQGGA